MRKRNTIDFILPQRLDSWYNLLSQVIQTPAMATDPIPIGRGEPRYAAELRKAGIAVALVASVEDVRGAASYNGVDLLLLDTSTMTDTSVRDCVRAFSKLKIPTIALVPEYGTAMFDASIPVEDVVILPPRPGEIVADIPIHSPRPRAPEHEQSERFLENAAAVRAALRSGAPDAALGVELAAATA